MAAVQQETAGVERHKTDARPAIWRPLCSHSLLYPLSWSFQTLVRLAAAAAVAAVAAAAVAAAAAERGPLHT